MALLRGCWENVGGVGGKGDVGGVQVGRAENDVDVGGGGGIPAGFQNGRGVVIAKCIGPRNIGIQFDASHVEVEEVCASDQAVKEGWHSGQG